MIYNEILRRLDPNSRTRKPSDVEFTSRKILSEREFSDVYPRTTRLSWSQTQRRKRLVQH